MQHVMRMVLAAVFAVVGISISPQAAAQSISLATLTLPPETTQNIPEISYSEFSILLKNGELASAEISLDRQSLTGTRKDGSKFTVVIPSNAGFADRLVAAGVDTRLASFQRSYNKPKPAEMLWWAFLGVIPWLFLLLIAGFILLLLTVTRRKAVRRAERIIELLEDTNRNLMALLHSREDSQNTKHPQNG